MDAASVGRKVRWARLRADMTQQELAQALEMPQPSIARIERGAVLPRTATLLAILEATGHQLAIEPRQAPANVTEIRKRLRMDVYKRTAQVVAPSARRQRKGPMMILSRLRRFGVPFVLIGELAEVAHGAPVDFGGVVEICHAETDVARRRLDQALEELGAKLQRNGLHTAVSSRLRTLTRTPAGDDYDILARNAETMLVHTGLQVQVAALEDLIRARLADGSQDGRQAAAVLRAIADGL